MGHGSAKRKSFSVIPLNNMCKTYSKTVTITAGGGNKTETIPFSWVDGWVHYAVSNVTGDWAADNGDPALLFTTYDAITNAVYTNNSAVSVRGNGSGSYVDYRTDNYSGVIVSATSTSITFKDDGTRTKYIKYTVYAPYSAVLAANGDNLIVTGTTAPTVIPKFIGQEYVNLTNGYMYKATGVAGIWNWGFIGQGGVTQFTNTTIPNMVAWYNCDNIASITKDINNKITRWEDLSGNSRHLIYTTGTTMNVAYAPTYTLNAVGGRPAALFNPTGPTRLITAAFTQITQPNTWICVFKPTNIGNGQYQVIHDGIGATTFRNAFMKNTGDAKALAYAGTVVYPTPDLDNTAQIRTSCFNGASGYYQKNNGTPGTLNSGAQGITGITLGADHAEAFGFEGYIAELMVFNRALSTSELATCLIEVNNRWGIYT